MVSRDEVTAALAAVPGPDGRTPLPDSGAISGVTIREGKVFVAIAIDPARAKAMEPMRAAAEAAIRAISGVAGAVVTLTAESARAATGAPPAHSHQTDAPARRHGRSSEPLPGVKHIIAVASGKGGVGKSTVACNLAVGLAKLGLKVGVLDADLFGPSMPRLFGIGAKPGLAPDGQKLLPLESCGVKVMSIGFLIEEGAPVIWRGPMVMSALNQLLREVVWGELDVLVVDMPPGTGDTQLTIAQNVPLAGAVIVSTPQDLALIDARRGIAMFGQVKVPLIGRGREYELFCLPPLRRADRRVLAWRRAQGGRKARRSVPWRGAARHRHPRQFRRRAPGGREHGRQPAGERAHRDRKARGGDARGRRAGGQARSAHPRALEKDQARMSWPTDITAMDKGRVLEVVFDDGGAIRLTAERLRVESPSAEVQGHSPSQKKTLTGKENVAIVGIEPVGNYAIKIIFDDGHDTGLYTWDYLRKLAM